MKSNALNSMDTPPRYGGVAILLHWLLAAVIVGLFIMGLYMADLPFSPQRIKLFNWHKWAGITFLSLTVLRLVWRITHRPPELPASISRAMPSWQLRAYHATHHLMYLLFFAVPLIGWAYSSAAGFPIVVFGLIPLPDWVPASKALAEIIKPFHQYASFALIGLVAVHMAAAIKHQLVDRDGLIARMMPGRG